ncbi:Peroxiredoxin [Halolactibacillus halophilus]|uniref:thioredoxin-dependent peroxiredoxin n=1 Tax=Halolactibacillus halophilus TaxID=306540 RepID=A0A1I5NL28_9BACI|nr:peroxiredoxin-like family protein [Halolactibacillus halophilus]GEM01365.1 peroxiredoxin [Halolactibacillus halophilus]SFP22513.1 Peroxiredoxin [Halolactibacillus halophilus]
MTSLFEDIKQLKEQFKQNASEKKQQLYAKATRELEESQKALGLEKGDQVPEFQLPDATGEIISIMDTLEDGLVILTFYRGGWCPYCNLELNAYQRELQAVKDAGATLIAISPETPDASLSTKEKNALEFIVLSDKDNIVAKKFDLVFSMPDYLIEMYQQSGLDVASHNGNQDWELPKPATFVINTAGKIVFAEVNSDYTQRTEPAKVIEIASKY